ncbi:MAG TPA: fibronectin type III domain-containing protein, partial [Terriglobales bacterium]|nr:fibronectin type III domain-containing protein [Terriglobales bacterium]
NSFSVRATTSGGGSSVQSWSVTPKGTVRVTWIDKYWSEAGAVESPYNWSVAPQFAAALVPKSDGTFDTIYGSGGADGVLTIPNVPGGYYWLRLTPRGIYWTSSSTFDFGADLSGSPAGIRTSPSPGATTTINFNFSGLEAIPSTGEIEVDVPGILSIGGTTQPNSTTYKASLFLGSTYDFSGNYDARVTQYKPAQLGSLDGFVLGRTLSLPNLTFTAGGINNVTGELQASPLSSVDLIIKGASWAPLFQAVAPKAVTAIGTSFELSVQQGEGPYTTFGRTTRLLWPKSVVPDGDSFPPVNSTGFSIRMPFRCAGSFESPRSFGFLLPPVLLTDQEFGTVQYGDPFPASWQRVFSLCQQAAVDLPLPGSSQTAKFVVTNGMATSVPNTPVAPLISPVQGPQINGADFFANTTIGSTSVSLSWKAPALGSAYGYTVQISTPTKLPTGDLAYISVATLGTAKTSVTVPPGILAPGRSYVFVITARSDARANMETSPNRSALPTASADIVSGLVTISDAAQ